MPNKARIRLPRLCYRGISHPFPPSDERTMSSHVKLEGTGSSVRYKGMSFIRTSQSACSLLSTIKVKTDMTV